jgi:hypothetical protein
MERCADGYSIPMDRPSPRDDDLWPEALWGLGLMGTVLMLVALIAALGH